MQTRPLSRGSLCCLGRFRTCSMSQMPGDHRGRGSLCAVSCKTMPISTRSCLQNQREQTSPICDKSLCSEPQVQATSRP